MLVYISPNTLKKQTKVLVKNWPGSSLKSVEARKILCLLYGYKSPHHYQSVMSEKAADLQQLNQNLFQEHLNFFVQRLAVISGLNLEQSLFLMKCLWPCYSPGKGHFLYKCSLRFIGELNDFLAKSQKDTTIPYSFNGNPSVKDSVEALGVPHTDVAALAVNGEFTDFSYQIKDGDTIEIYPSHCDVEIPEDKKFALMPAGKEKPTFVLDVHLGSLARYLRMAGFDTWYQSNDSGDKELSHIAEEGRIMLSRDFGLLKRSNVLYGRWVRNTDPKKQFHEIIQHYQLKDQIDGFGLCTSCNGELKKVSKDDIKDNSEVSEFLIKKHQEFKQCQSCQKIFWKGSHYENMQEFFNQVRNGE